MLSSVVKDQGQRSQRAMPKGKMSRPNVKGQGHKGQGQIVKVKRSMVTKVKIKGQSVKVMSNVKVKGQVHML